MTKTRQKNGSNGFAVIKCVCHKTDGTNVYPMRKGWCQWTKLIRNLYYETIMHIEQSNCVNRYFFHASISLAIFEKFNEYNFFFYEWMKKYTAFLSISPYLLFLLLQPIGRYFGTWTAFLHFEDSFFRENCSSQSFEFTSLQFRKLWTASPSIELYSRNSAAQLFFISTPCVLWLWCLKFI